MVYSGWVPKKLLVEITTDPNGVLDFEKYIGNNCELQPGE